MKRVTPNPLSPEASSILANASARIDRFTANLRLPRSTSRTELKADIIETLAQVLANDPELVTVISDADAYLNKMIANAATDALRKRRRIAGREVTNAGVLLLVAQAADSTRAVDFLVDLGRTLSLDERQYALLKIDGFNDGDIKLMMRSSRRQIAGYRRAIKRAISEVRLM